MTVCLKCQIVDTSSEISLNNTHILLISRRRIYEALQFLVSGRINGLSRSCGCYNKLHLLIITQQSIGNDLFRQIKV